MAFNDQIYSEAYFINVRILPFLRIQLKDRIGITKTLSLQSPSSLRFLQSFWNVMSRATADDQLKFLLSCVKFSNSGKVSAYSLFVDAYWQSQIDFVEVAKECGIVSKGAAWDMSWTLLPLLIVNQGQTVWATYEGKWHSSQLWQASISIDTEGEVKGCYS